MVLRLAYGPLGYLLFPLLCGIIVYRWFFYKRPRYRYALTNSLSKHGLVTTRYHQTILFGLRSCALLLLCFLTLRPQWVDERSQINVEGIDIVLALDVSGSMQLFDDVKDRRPRIDVAKQEAIRFINKRTNDPIGIVVFGADTLSLAPLTLDKQMLKNVIGTLQLGVINPNGTFLGTGLATAVNRLKNSQAKSKIIILLSDGEPTPHEKIDPDTALDLASSQGIKIYTIGIGNQEGGYMIGPFGNVQTMGARLNTMLLEKIAQKTGGVFFKAHNPQDMRAIYDKIDQLERTSYETNMFHRYYEAFGYFMWVVMLLFAVETFLRLWLWRGI